MATPSFIAILGGSFDPIHNGHLELAEIVSQHIKYAEIYFVPCGNPVHRAPSNVSANNRIAMVKSAIADRTHWHLDTYEIDRLEPSYTINTLRHFRQRFPDTPIGFIMGADTFLSLETWGNWQELLNYAHLLVVPRLGYEVTSKEHLIKNRLLSKLAPVRKVGEGSERKTGVYTLVHEDLSTEPTNKFSTGVEFGKKSNENLLHKTLNGSIIMLPVAPQAISSTEIRKKIAAHDDVSSLIPKAVYDYIRQQKLYL